MKRIKALVLMLLAGIAAAGCSMSTGPQSTASNDVRDYYIHLQSTNVEYRYTVTAPNVKYMPATGELVMDMQGPQTDTWSSMPVYGCDWSYPNFSGPQMWYYAVDQNKAVNLGIEYNGKYTDSWVDLQAPLDLNKTWTFTSNGETITATVTKYGSSAKVQGVDYSDVMVVTYSGNNGTTGTEWFSKGKGLLYYNVSRPNFGSVENQLETIQTK